MNRPRITIARMLVLVGLVGVWFAALKAASEPWASAVYTTTLVLLGAGLAGALLRRGRRRAFWVGFAVFGWGYWLLLFGPPSSWLNWAPPALTDVNVAPRLITTLLLEWLEPSLARPFRPTVGSGVAVRWGSAGSYYPADLVALDLENARVQIRWQNYPIGSEEWVATNRLRASGPNYYLSIGHALWSILAALLGGLIARLAFGGSDEDGP